MYNDPAGDPTQRITRLSEGVRTQPIREIPVGSVIAGRYELQERLGGGGMGDVFKALDRLAHGQEDPDPYVALKILKPELQQDLTSIKALQREANRALKLTHTNIVRVRQIERDPDTGIHFIVMELLVGRTVQSVIAAHRGGQPWAQVSGYVAQICAGLECAHREGIIHSDIKPSNLFITERDEIKILDFGIAAPVPGVGADSRETRMDARKLGARTPEYASLEMFLGHEPHYSDDVYSLACVIHEWLGGVHPYMSRELPRRALAAPEALAVGARPARQPGLTGAQNAGLLRALALSRTERTQTVAELARALADARSPGRGRTFALGVAAVPIAGVLAYAAMTRMSDPASSDIATPPPAVQADSERAHPPLRSAGAVRGAAAAREAPHRPPPPPRPVRAASAASEAAPAPAHDTTAETGADRSAVPQEEPARPAGNVQPPDGSPLQVATGAMPAPGQARPEGAMGAGADPAGGEAVRARPEAGREESEDLRRCRAAAGRGDADAQARLGYLYATGGAGLVKDEAMAARWFLRAARSGNTLAELNLGVMYQEGRGGLPQSPEDAVRWFVLAARQGNARVESLLGSMYQYGQGGLPRSDREAARWLTLAARQGDADAQARLGFMIATGRGGLPQDEREAARLLGQAAQQGNASGEYNLAVMYENGRGGLPRSEAEALQWLTRAARHGSVDAQRRLRAIGRSW